ncbi:MAG: TonB-dependent receptor [Sulfurovum sp.]|nr:TonB-dependent receptor [Sulfurovum sp.]
MFKKAKIALASMVLLGSSSYALEVDSLQIFGYGNINFSNYDYLENYQSDPERRSKVDMERFVLITRYMFDENITLIAEIEYEHGGTGSAMEYDRLEEFGEFETEIEKGGEIVIEELNVDIKYKPELNFRVGHMLVGMGMLTARHLPFLHHSVYRNRSESRIIPSTWHETGVEAYGTFAENFHYQAQLLTGLNSELFDSYGWIKNGMQKRFEHVNADDLAGVIRLSYGDLIGDQIGISYYQGNSGGNRNKDNRDIEGTVQIVSVHGVFSYENFTARGLYMWGTLSDSAEITRANYNLPKTIRAKNHSVAKEAVAYFAEVGYNFGPAFGMDNALTLWGRYDFSDTMYKVETGVIKKDRYEQTTISAGINYQISENVMIKTEYEKTSFGIDVPDMESYTASLAFQF